MARTVSTNSQAGGADPPGTTGVRPVPRARAYEMVIQQVERHIAAGDLHVGDRLPAERDLAARLGVSRAAVREAMRALEAHGVVRAAVGVGPDSGTVLTSVPSAALTQLLRLHIALANFPMADVLEARIMLERWSARLAAQQATAEDLGGLGELVATMHEVRVDREAFNEVDSRFHVAIAEAGRNRLVVDLTTAIRESVRGPILGAFRATATWGDFCGALLEQHRAVYEAITARDGGLAADALEAHIRFADEALGLGASDA